MSIRNKIIGLCVVALVGSGGYTGFKAGCFWEHRVDQSEAVANDAAHWNPHSREFVWGSAELDNLAQLDLNDVFEGAMRPAHKPKVKP